MTRRKALAAGLAVLALLSACRGPLRPPASARAARRPDQVLDFNALYAQNCAACHGLDGKGGASIALSDPVYLAIADDAVLGRAIARGVAGTPMPGFAKSAGGSLTPEQVSALVKGLRDWAKPGALAGQRPPPYAAAESGGARRGARVFAAYCASCHGLGGTGGTAGSVVDTSYLALTSDQGLRTVVIMGRRELGAPDWRGDLPGRPMTGRQVTDVVAWLEAQRVRYPGRPYPAGAQARTRKGEKP